MHDQKFKGLQSGLLKLLDSEFRPPEMQEALQEQNRNIKVLVVDEYQARRKALHHQLIAGGISSVHSANISTALLRLRDGDFDVIFVRHDDFKGDAFEKLASAVSNSPSGDSPILVLVQEPTSQKLFDLRRNGAHGLISPPFNTTRLITKFLYLKFVNERRPH